MPLNSAAVKAMGTKGFVRAYVDHYRTQLGLLDCPADLEIIEQVVLARNSAQHNGNLVMNAVEHDSKTRAKYPRPFFSRPGGPDEASDGLDTFLGEWVHVDREKLLRATEQVEVLADWLQGQIYAR